MSARTYNTLVVVACVWGLTAIALRDRLTEIAIRLEIPAYVNSLMKAFMILFGVRLIEYPYGTLFLTSLLGCFILDRLVAQLRGRYQIIHCVGNIAVAALAWEPAAKAFMHPSTALQGDSYLSPYIIALRNTCISCAGISASHLLRTGNIIY